LRSPITVSSPRKTWKRTWVARATLYIKRSTRTWSPTGPCTGWERSAKPTNGTRSSEWRRTTPEGGRRTYDRLRSYSGWVAGGPNSGDLPCRPLQAQAAKQAFCYIGLVPERRDNATQTNIAKERSAVRFPFCRDRAGNLRCAQHPPAAGGVGGDALSAID